MSDVKNIYRIDIAFEGILGYNHKESRHDLIINICRDRRRLYTIRNLITFVSGAGFHPCVLSQAGNQASDRIKRGYTIVYRGGYSNG